MRILYDSMRLLVVAFVAPFAFAPAVILGRLAHENFGLAGVLAVVPLLVYLGVFLFLTGCALLCRILVGRLAPGEAKPGSKLFIRWGLYTLFHSFALGELKPFLSTYFGFQSIYYGLMGAKLGKNVTFAPHVTVLEPCLLEVGDDVTIGGFALLATHAGLRDGTMQLGSIRIGNKTLIGGLSNLAPGTTIGDGTTIGFNTSILPGVTVGANVRTGPYTSIRSGASIGDGTVLSFGTLIPEKTVVGANERWAGNPGAKR